MVSSQPRRIFNVTGTDTAATTAPMIAAAKCGSRISAEPDNFPVTLRAGHPILMSMKVAPRSTHIRAASAITGGSHPANWIDNGASASASIRNLRISLRTFANTAALATISVTTNPPPDRRTARRNGQSVIPDIGAKMAACGTGIPPIDNDMNNLSACKYRAAQCIPWRKTPR